MNILWFHEIDSTNSAILNDKMSLPDKTIYATEFQSQGRGQRGNHWESAHGKNLLFSILFKPANIPASMQFLISEAVTLGIIEYLGKAGITAMIKWPNDIYVGDKKICGILIENSIIASKLDSSIVGIGLNINQTSFTSNAPNPVSLAMLTGKFYNLKAELIAVSDCIEHEYDSIGADTETRFLEHLYWKGEWHEFKDCTDNSIFTGKIIGIDEAARVLVERVDGTVKAYAFKEITYCIKI